MMMWTFTDLSTDEVWTMPKNPKSMSNPYPKKQISAQPAGTGSDRRATASQRLAHEWSFEGSTRTQDHLTTLAQWSQRDSVVRVSDHIGRTFDVVFVELTPEEKRANKVGGLIHYRFRYTMKCLLLAYTEAGD